MSDARLSDLLDEERFPCVDGVYLPSGEVVVMECAQNLWVRPLAGSTLASILSYNEDMMTSLGPLFTERAFGYVISGGEGSNGSEGFLALRSADGALVWVAYFQTSNPFTGARVEGDRVIAETNLGHRWSFPIGDPARVTVVWKPG